MTLLSINEDREYSAEWTLPGSDRTVAGRLSYTRESATLHLNDAFTPPRGVISISDPIRDYPVVHGVSSKGEAISLLKAQSLGVAINLSSGGMRQPEQVISPWVVVGAHVDSNTLYSAVSFFIPALEVWLSKPTIAHTLESATTTGKSKSTFVVQSPETESTPVSQIDADLRWGAGVTVSANPFTSIDLVVRGWVAIQPKSPRTLDWFLDQQDKLSVLLAFLAGVPMPIEAIHASIQLATPPLSVLVTMRQADACKFKNPSDFFVSRGALGSTFPCIVERWFSEVDSVRIPSQLALSVISTKTLWLHVEFLSLVQALEGFHRSRYSGTYMNEAEYDAVKSAIAAAIPVAVASDHREALRSRIRYGNQISLSKRLNELRDCLGVELAAVVIASDGKIPRKWIDTRNYLSHWDEELRPNAIEGQEMYNANVRMEHFLRALYLLMVGIAPETLVQCLRNVSRTSQQLVQLNIISRRESDPSAPSGVLMTIGHVDGSQSLAAEEDLSKTECGDSDPQSA